MQSTVPSQLGSFHGTNLLQSAMHFLDLALCLSAEERYSHHAQGACTNPPDLFIVTEFLFGGDLNQYLVASKANIDWATRLRMAQEIAKGNFHRVSWHKVLFFFFFG
jgi:hypothetical protein